MKIKTLNEIAQETYGKPFVGCSTDEKIVVVSIQRNDIDIALLEKSTNKN